jgi:hypothetical protein
MIVILYIKYDSTGKILGTFLTPGLPSDTSVAFPDKGTGESVLEVAENSIPPNQTCAQIHLQYKVNTKTKKLVKK